MLIFGTTDIRHLRSNTAITDTDIQLVIMSLTRYQSRDSSTVRYCGAHRSDGQYHATATVTQMHTCQQAVH